MAKAKNNEALPAPTGKTYGYQEAEGSPPGMLDDGKAKVVEAFDDFLDSLIAKVGAVSGSGAGTGSSAASGSGAGGAATSGSPGTSSTGTSGGASSGTSGTSSSGTASTGAAGTGAGDAGKGASTSGGSEGSLSSGSGSGSVSSGGKGSSNGQESLEAQEVSLFAQREAFRLDRARETTRRPRQERESAAANVAVAAVETNPHQTDSNRAPLTRHKEFGSSFGAAGRPTTPTIEKLAVPASRRPETIPALGVENSVRPIDAYYGSFGTAVERAAARAKVRTVILESVIGVDDRIRVTNTQEYPWRCIASLLITASTGMLYVGTAWLVAPRLLLTAGHCVYMADEGGWVREIEVIPGRDATQRPFGSAIARDFRSVTGWTQDNNSDFDYGAILLPEDKRYGDQLGWFGYASRTDEYLTGLEVNVSGYPGDGGHGPDLEDGSQWYNGRSLAGVQPRQVTYEIDTYGGQSGAPVWETTSTSERYGIAIHTWGTSVSNGGTRITGDVFDNIVAWAGQVP